MLGTALKVTGIDHVVLHVRDLEKAKRFYIDLLGFSVAHESSWQSFLSCGSQQVALFRMRDGSEIHAGSEMNHMRCGLRAASTRRSKRSLKLPAFRCMAVLATTAASISTIQTVTTSRF